MAGDRTVRVNLVAQVQGYLAGMDQAAKKTRDVATEAEKLAAKKQAFTEVGHSALAFGALAAAGVALAVAKFAEFDQAMSQVKAATQESASNMALLRDASLEAGAKTVFSATEAANAVEELGKAGLSTQEILKGGLNGALSLAAAGGLDVARAAEIAAISMKQFNLEGEDVPHIADLLAAGAGKAAGDVEDLAQALNQSALVANQTGLSIEETTGTLGAFASAGLLGSDAGTSFKTMLQRLTPSSKEAQKEMERLGISAYDAQGQFIGMSQFAGNLRDSMKVLTPEARAASMSIIFGSDAVRAASVVYENGAEGIQKWIDQTNDSGYAAKVAADRLDNLAGDIEQLGGSLDTALIKTGSGANVVLRDMVQSATFLVNAFGDIPAPALNTGLAIGAAAAAVALVGGGALVAIPRLAALKTALGTLEVGAKGVTAAVGLTAGALVAAGLVLSFWASRAADAQQMTDSFAGSLDSATGAVTKYTEELVTSALQQKGIYDEAEKAGVSQSELTEAILEGGDAYSKVRKQIDDFQASQGAAGVFTNLFSGHLFTLQGDLDDVAGSVENARKAHDNLSAATEYGADSTDDAATALEALSGKAQDAELDVNALADAIRGFGSAQLDVNSAARGFESAVDDLSDSIEKNGVTLDRTTEAGRANDAAVDSLAKSTLELAAATLEQTNSQSDANGVINEGRKRLIDMLGQLGITGAEAEAYADKLGLIPANVDTAARLSIDWDAINSYVNKLNNIPGYKETVINQVFKETGAPHGQVGAAYNANGSIMEFYARGGLRERHVAQIAPAGSWRVWAEPETGGEAYIPLAQGKRHRSLDILAETARRFGYSITPMASGGVLTGSMVQYAPPTGGSGHGSAAVDNSINVTVAGNTVASPEALAGEIVRRQRQAIAISGIRRVGVA